MRPAADPHLPGNMVCSGRAFEADPADLVKSGRRAGPARPWLGVAADEIQGRLLVTRVSPEGRPIRRECMSATSSSASAETPCIRRRSSSQGVGTRHCRQRNPAPRLQDNDVRDVNVPRSTDWITSAGSRCFDLLVVAVAWVDPGLESEDAQVNVK